MSYLLDTCVLSKLRKIKKFPDKKLEKWIDTHHETSYFISVITLGEIQSGISKLNMKKESDRQKRHGLESWFQEELIPRFNDRILCVDVDVMLAWGRLTGEAQKRGISIPVIDGLLAATAIANNLAVVTENIGDFLDTGARLCNPWG